MVGQALKMKVHWMPLNSSKVDALHAACRQGISDLLLQKVLSFADADAVQFCSKMAERSCAWRIVPAVPGGCENTLRFSSIRSTAASRRAIYPAVSYLPSNEQNGTCPCFCWGDAAAVYKQGGDAQCPAMREAATKEAGSASV
jgi:hypothetical protein